jgi:hypothetical protein
VADKKIDTLIEDIYDVVSRPEGVRVEEQDRISFANSLSRVITTSLEEEERDHTLRMSNLGKCDRYLWFAINEPRSLEPLRPEVYLKFLLGHVWEGVLLFLAKVAGHSVEGEQDEIERNGIKGHRDAVIDGVTTDVKSASSFSFDRFDKHLKPEDDSFGYIDQLGLYADSTRDDPLVTDKERTAFFVGDKTLGKLTLDFHPFPKKDYDRVVEEKKEMLKSLVPPHRSLEYADVPYNKGGNRAIPTVCSYCQAKGRCWPKLRGFSYASGPVYMTKVVKTPTRKDGSPVPEFEVWTPKKK